MPDLNLEAISAARERAADTDKQLVSTAARLSAAEQERLRLLRTGSSEAAVTAAAAQVEQISREHEQLLGEYKGQRDRIRDESEAFLVGIDPQTLVGTLDARVPVMLLPVRLETQFRNEQNELRIRIYPEAIHLDGHETELTENERTAGERYWTARLQARQDRKAAADAWRELATAFGVRRGAWIVEALTPENLDRIAEGEQARFPEPGTRANPWSRAVRAALLPDRWAAVGFVGETAVFTKWGRHVDDSLAVTPSPGPGGETPEEDELPVDDAMRWVIDYDRALQEGMAITVTDADLAEGRRIRDGLTRLIVMGVDWTLKPEASAETVGRIISSHRFSDGASFLVPGTATNNTAAARAGALAQDIDVSDPAVPPTLSDAESGSRQLARALGLANGSTFDHFLNAQMREATTASQMFEAMWVATGDYYLGDLFSPLISAATIDTTRDHCVQFVRPGGPFAAMRIAKQPYGFLPIVAAGQFRPLPGFEERLAELLPKIRAFAEMGAEEVPTMNNLNATPEENLRRIIQMSPMSEVAQYRRVLGSTNLANLEGMSELSALQGRILSFIGPLLGMANAPKIWTLTLDKDAFTLHVPWVQAGTIKEGDALEPNYIQQVAALTRQHDIDALNREEDADTLLHAFLAYSATRQLDRTGELVLGAHLSQDIRLLTPETVGIEPLQRVPANSLVIQSSRELRQAVVPAVTQQKTVSEFVRETVASSQFRLAPGFASLARFFDALDALATRPAAELDRAFRGVLDCFGYRLDAWYTSLATKRLQEMRAARPIGIHIGGYGWVDNLKPDEGPQSRGYVHAPSVAHGLAAAVLRSGHLAHNDAEHDALNIDLSSERVRAALEIISALEQQQMLAAVLGYRFERSMRERGLEFAKFILPIRKLAPLRPPDPELGPQPQENISARDVVDAVGLLDRWRRDSNAVLNAIDPAPSPAERDGIAAEVEKLAALFDSVADLLMSDAVFHAVNGNPESAAAALAALDRQGRPVQPRVAETPRSGQGYTQRVAIIAQDANVPAEWAAFPIDARAGAEPRLNAWIARRLGDPARFRFAAKLGDNNLSSTLANLGLSPLALVLSTASAGQEHPTEFQERIKTVMARQLPADTADGDLVLLDDPPSDSPSGSIGLGPLLALLGWLRVLVSGKRALDGRDVTLPQDQQPSGIDVSDLEQRANVAEQFFSQAKTAVDAAAQSATVALPAGATSAQVTEAVAAIRSTLDRASQAGVSDAFPPWLSSAGTAEEYALLATRLLRVQRDMQATTKRLKALSAAPPGIGTSAEQAADYHISRLRAIFGEAFPVLALFSVPNALELSASLNDRASLTGGDSLAAISCLQQWAMVRPALDPLACSVSASEWLGSALDPEELLIMQLPHSPGQRWAALSFGGKPQPAADLAVLTVGTANPQNPMAGLIIDGWYESIPNAEETTALTFHYDAPGARAPHAMLLAVPPDTTTPFWSFPALLATVQEAAALSRLRAISYQNMKLLPTLLPAVYLPDNFTKDVPGISFRRFADRFVATEASMVLGH